jgi:hypothetical protein
VHSSQGRTGLGHPKPGTTHSPVRLDEYVSVLSLGDVSHMLNDAQRPVLRLPLAGTPNAEKKGSGDESTAVSVDI